VTSYLAAGVEEERAVEHAHHHDVAERAERRRDLVGVGLVAGNRR